MTKQEINIFWFRRDLRLEDNAGLYHALKAKKPVIPLFIFDTEILSDIDDKSDPRVTFIHKQIGEISTQLKKHNSSFLVKNGNPASIWEELTNEYSISSVFTNHDYEPYAIIRDKEVNDFLRKRNISFHTYKDQVIFEKNEVLKDDDNPYTVYTPYMKKWKQKLTSFYLKSYPTEKYFDSFIKENFTLPSLQELSFKKSGISFPKINLSDNTLSNYKENRDFPNNEGASNLSPHLRFGTVSIRKIAQLAKEKNEQFLNELIWREFFMQILFHFPKVVNNNFRDKYDGINWRNNEEEFQFWCEGKTGYPMVDAGMRQLNQTGMMHNRVRMVVASFLTKHLLINWQWGEAYFAKKLLDYELSSNNGNWQWAAGTGCDAAPYFRIFNPETQLKKFDPDLKYTKKWVPEFGTEKYTKPIVNHKEARERALHAYKAGIETKS